MTPVGYLVSKRQSGDSDLGLFDLDVPYNSKKQSIHSEPPPPHPTKKAPLTIKIKRALS